MQLFDSSLHLRDVIFHGHNCGVTLSKVLADGTLRIPLPLWVNRILSLNTIVFFGTVGWMQTKRLLRKQKRKLSYYSNIYVVKDSANPENEGKTFLYKFGKKIFDKITAAMQPEFEDEDPINPFDFWQGANFKLKIKNVAGFWNYDSSEFAWNLLHFLMMIINLKRSTTTCMI